MLFCDTPIQSISIGISAGVIGAVVFGFLLELSIAVTVILIGFTALLLELLVHSYRQDAQFQACKQQIQQKVS